MNDVAYVVEEYVHWEGSTTLGVYTDKSLAVERIEKFLEKKSGVFNKNPNSDEWNNGSVSYLINEIILNQDI